MDNSNFPILKESTKKEKYFSLKFPKLTIDKLALILAIIFLLFIITEKISNNKINYSYIIIILVINSISIIFIDVITQNINSIFKDLQEDEGLILILVIILPSILISLGLFKCDYFKIDITKEYHYIDIMQFTLLILLFIPSIVLFSEIKNILINYDKYNINPEYYKKKESKKSIFDLFDFVLNNNHIYLWSILYSFVILFDNDYKLLLLAILLFIIVWVLIIYNFKKIGKPIDKNRISNKHLNWFIKIVFWIILISYIIYSIKSKKNDILTTLLLFLPILRVLIDISCQKS